MISKMQQETDLEIAIEGLINAIKERGANSVGMQLPEGFIRQARRISGEIQDRCGIPVIISGRPTYGACDIDKELLGMVDLLFHFGHAGESMGKIIFVEMRSSIDIRPVVESAIKYLKGNLISIVTTVQHLGMIKDAGGILTSAGKRPLIRRGSGDGLRYEGQVLGCNASAVDERAEEVLFIGSGRFHPEGIARITKKRVVAADPYTGRVETIDPEPLIRRRWGTIAKALGARVFGVVLSSKMGQYRKKIADKIMKEAKDHSIEAHLILLDEVREDLLINLGMDAYINTACPRIVDDMRHVILLNPDEFREVLRMRG